MSHVLHKPSIHDIKEFTSEKTNAQDFIFEKHMEHLSAVFSYFEYWVVSFRKLFDISDVKSIQVDSNSIEGLFAGYLMMITILEHVNINENASHQFYDIPKDNCDELVNKIMQLNKDNHLCSIILNEHKNILLDISRHIISLTNENVIPVLCEIYRKWTQLMMSFGTFGFTKLTLIQTKSIDKYSNAPYIFNLENIMENMMLPTKVYKFTIKTADDVDTHVKKYMSTEVFDYKDNKAGFLDETMNYEITDMDIKHYNGDNITFRNTIANIKSIVDPWNKKIIEIIIENSNKELIDKLKKVSLLQTYDLIYPISFYNDIPLKSLPTDNEFYTLVSSLKTQKEKIAIFRDPFTYAIIKNENEYYSSLLNKPELLIKNNFLDNQYKFENILVLESEDTENQITERYGKDDTGKDDTGKDFTSYYAPSEYLNSSISSWIRDDDEIIPEILERFNKTLDAFLSIKTVEKTNFYVFHGAQEMIPTTKNAIGKNEFTTWAYFSTTYDMHVAQDFAGWTHTSGHIYVFKIENVPFVKLELCSQLVFPIGVEFVEAQQPFLEIANNKTSDNHTLHWYTNKPYTFELQNIKRALGKKSEYPKTDFIKKTYKSNIIQRDTELKAVSMGSSIMYIDSRTHTFNKKAVKIAIHEPFNQSFKRCLNEMLAAYTFEHLFELQTLDFKLVYSELHNVLLLQSVINNNIQRAEQVALTNAGATVLKTSMGNEFLIDCIMCNWDAYVNGNCLIIDDPSGLTKTFRVDVGGCLKYRAMGEDRFGFVKGKVPSDHETILRHTGMKLIEENIKSNMDIIANSSSKFADFKITAMLHFGKIINMMNMDKSLIEKYTTFVNDTIDIIGYRLGYYLKHGETHLKTIIASQVGGAIEPHTKLTTTIQISQVVNENIFGSFADLNAKIAKKLGNQSEEKVVNSEQQGGGFVKPINEKSYMSHDFNNMNNYIKNHRSRPWLAY